MTDISKISPSFEEEFDRERAELELTEGWEAEGALALFESGVPLHEACNFFEVTELEVRSLMGEQKQ